MFSTPKKPRPEAVPDTFSPNIATPPPTRNAAASPAAVPNTLTNSPQGTSFVSIVETVPHAEKAYLFGTQINVEELSQKMRTFLLTFRTSENAEPKYKQELLYIVQSQDKELNIDLMDVFAFDPKLYKYIVTFPSELIPIFDHILQVTITAELKQFDFSRKLLVKLYNMRDIKHMRDLNPNDIDQLVTLRGMVTRTSEIIPDLKQGFFKCSVCNFTVNIPVSKGKIDEPSRCASCGKEGAVAMVHNMSTFENKQIIKLQETPESIPEGETPHTVSLCAFDTLVETVKPGDRVDVTGIYRAVPTRVNPMQRKVKSLFRTYIDVIHFQKTGLKILQDEAHNMYEMKSEAIEQLQGEMPEQRDRGEQEETETAFAAPIHITRQDEKKLIELSKSPDIYEKLTSSIAPGIWQLDDVKKGVLCQLFGGVHKKIPNGKIRGEINILLVGDPGVSKSQLLMHIHKIAPRGIYTSGKGSTAVGLTAYVTRDPDSGDFVLESGALVLSDLGICCIDEFDKMSEATRSILHEVMEQQTVSVAKAGIICSLNARTSILAAANPKESTYNESLSIVENIMLPPTLLSRFDLIYLLRDKPDKANDMFLAKHIIALYCANSNLKEPEIDITTLTKYISYARRKIHPVITDEAKKSLVNKYIKLRRLGSHKKQITATTRQLESLIRLSEGLARMRFSQKVEKCDVKEANRLVRNSIFKAAVDPKSGQVDIDLLTTGISKDQREELQKQSAVDEDLESNLDLG